jgi:AraC-like DNA-binding protein
MSPALVSFLYVAMMTVSCLVTITYVSFNWNNQLFGKLMSVTFILITYGLFTSFCASQGFFIYFPHIARTGYLVLLAITPLLYLCLIRGVPNIPLKRIDLIHFIPSFVYFINYIPFYLLSKDKKIELFESPTFTSFDEGWILPKYFVIILSVGQILFYLILASIQLFFPAWKNKLTPKKEKRFLYTFFIYLILMLLPPLATFITSFTGTYASSPIILTYISSQLIFFLIVLSQPKFLYAKRFHKGITTSPEENVAEPEKEEPNDWQSYLNQNPDLDDESQRIIEEITFYLEKNKSHLSFEFDQKEITEKLNFSGYQIRTALKNAFSISFSDFVNYQRIQYLISMLEKDPKWKNYTMATLANSIGFKSTNSLYLAFKKVMKTTPKDYIDRMND